MNKIFTHCTSCKRQYTQQCLNQQQGCTNDYYKTCTNCNWLSTQLPDHFKREDSKYICDNLIEIVSKESIKETDFSIGFYINRFAYYLLNKKIITRTSPHTS